MEVVIQAASRTTSRDPTFASQGCQKKRKNKKLEIYLKKKKVNFPNLLKEIEMQAQEAQTVTNNMDGKRPTPRHIIIKMPRIKDKERNLQATREKQLQEESPTKTVS